MGEKVTPEEFAGGVAELVREPVRIVSRDRGRPSVYTPEIAAEICERLAGGESLKRICRDAHMPSDHTVRLWAIENRHGFFPQYARAREVQYLAMADDTLDIADDGRNDWMASRDPDNPGYRLNGEAVARSRVRLDQRKWLLSKMLPKVFGERTQVEHSGQVEQSYVVRVPVAPKDHDEWLERYAPKTIEGKADE